MREKLPTRENGKQIESVTYFDKFFESNPELALIGTKEQYTEYIKTIFPESKIQTLVYHETNGDWFMNEKFDKEKVGRTDHGYYGKGFYFATTIGIEGHYGTNAFLSKLNIKNPKYNIETHTVSNQILSGQSKEESKRLAMSWLHEKITYHNTEITKLKNGEILKHNDIPYGIDFDAYWENERIARIEEFSKLVNKFRQQLEEIDSIIDEYYSYDAFITSDDISSYEEIMVRDPDQIHILGSTRDKESFKEFISLEGHSSSKNDQKEK